MDHEFLPIMRLQFSPKYSDPDVFVKTIQHDVDRAIEASSRLDKTRKKIKTIGRYVRPKNVEIPGIISYQPAYDSHADAPIEDQMEDYLIKAWETLKKCNLNGVVFLLDEFHAIRDVKVNKWYVLADLIGTFNTLQMKGYRYSLVLCGLPPMLRNVKESRSYSERMFTVIPISNLHENDAKNAILEPIRTTHRSFSDN